MQHQYDILKKQHCAVVLKTKRMVSKTGYGLSWHCDHAVRTHTLI